MDHEHGQGITGDFLILDGQNLADAMRRINHQIPRAKAEFLDILLGMFLVFFLFHCRRHLTLRRGVMGTEPSAQDHAPIKRGSPAPIGSATRTHVTGIGTRVPRAYYYSYHKTWGKARAGAMLPPQPRRPIGFFLSLGGIR